MKKILYIEDHKDTAEAVKQMLDEAGYEVALSFNGKDGLKKAHEKKFDLEIGRASCRERVYSYV
jgi:DNA-binding response OmpR family regulator